MNLFNCLVSSALSAVASALRDPPLVRTVAPPPRPRAVLCVQCSTEIDVTGTHGPYSTAGKAARKAGLGGRRW